MTAEEKAVEMQVKGTTKMSLFSAEIRTQLCIRNDKAFINLEPDVSNLTNQNK